MSQPRPKLTHDEKVSALLPTVQPDSNGAYWVASLDLKGWQFRVSPRTATTNAHCQCEDFTFRSAGKEGYRCIHIAAVRLFIKAQRAAATKPPEPKLPSIKSANLLSMQQHIERIAIRQAQLRESIPKGLSMIEA